MPTMSAQRYLNIIRPSLDVPDVAVFSYPGLEGLVRDKFHKQFETADEIFERYDSDDEEALDLRLSHEYILISALKLQKARTDKERRMWSQRYTLASIENFGEPNVNQAAVIAAAELPKLIDAAQSSPLNEQNLNLLIDAYSNLAKLYDGEGSMLEYHDVLSDVKSYLQNNYPAVHDCLSGDDSQVLDYVAVCRLFEKALALLEWSDWKIKSNQTAQMSVSPQLKTINIGKYIPDLSLKRVRALFAHEVLTHAQRAVNGAKNDINLMYGLPGYLASEEGLGVVMESSIEGELPHRVADRYIDITLALGTRNSRPMSRFELFKITMTRMLLRLGDAGEYANRSVVRLIAWQHVNRIYRGSLGNEFVGVFTRDIAYYKGFRKMIRYLQKYQTDDFDEALEFALSGKFDPSNSAHRIYVHKRRFGVEAGTEELAQ